MNLKKYLLSLVLLVAILLVSCKQESVITPISFSNIIAEVTGAVTLKYTGAGVVTNSTLGNSLVLNLATSSKVGDKRYLLGVFLFFKDFQEKTGVFQFADKEGVVPGDFAVGTFDVIVGNDKKSFVSDSGQVEITEIKGTTVRGTFYFRAKDENTGEVIEVKNGLISFQ